METFIISNEFFFIFLNFTLKRKKGREEDREREKYPFPYLSKNRCLDSTKKKKCQINEMKSHRIRNRWKRYRIVFLGKYFNYDNEYFTKV